MNGKSMKGMTLALLMMMAAFAGCLGGDTDDAADATSLDNNDGGYEYASDVDNHRMLMADVCDIKALAEAHDWAGVKDIYMNGKHAEKSDGSYRTLEGIANAEGKKHGLDTYYGTAVPLHDFLMAAIDGTGMFEGTSDAVREQAVEKGVQNQIMIAYAVHELNSALAKAAAGNWDVDSGAPHAWDEGWAFYHGPDDADFDYDGCSPYKTGDKRAGNFATANAAGTANANAAILEAMNNGLAALMAENLEDATMWTDEVIKNLVIIYSQATIRYASKMSTDTTVEDAQTHQSEGYAFWRVIESMVYNAYNSSSCYNAVTWNASTMDDATSCNAYSYMTDYDMGDGQDICYNMVSHTVSGDNSTNCAAYTFIENYTMNDGQDICYNMVSHTVSGDNATVCAGYMFVENYTMNDGQDICYNMATHTVSGDDQATCEAYGFYNTTAPDNNGYQCYNDVNHAFSNDSETTCDQYAYYENQSWGGSTFTGCYNMGTHQVTSDSQEACESYAWYQNGTVVDDYCYNMVSHAVDYAMDANTCGSFAYYENYGATVTDICYNVINHWSDANMSQAECEAFGYYVNYGATVTDICYNTATHWSDTSMSQAECEAFGYYVNYGATMFTGCYNGVTHQSMADATQAECEAYTYGHHGVAMINHIYDFSNVPVQGNDYEGMVRMGLQPAWTALGITTADIGTLQ